MQHTLKTEINMNAKTRATIIVLVMSLLAVLIAPTAMAGDTFNLLTGNNEFDTTNEHGFYFLDPWWTVTNSTADVLDCFNATVAAFSGDCAFRFKGSAIEKSVLKQVVVGSDLDTLNGFVGDAPVSIQMTYMVNSLTPNTSLKAMTIVKLSNGTTLKSVAPFTGTTKIGEFTSWAPVNGTTVIIPQDSTVTKVITKFANKSIKGKAFIDNVNVLFASQAS
jgi:hypothetical protein